MILDDICKPKKLDSLGVCELQMIKLALLGKWIWCLLLGALSIWHDIRKIWKYANFVYHEW